MPILPGMRRFPALVSLFLAAALGPPASGQVRGGGPKATDCLTQFVAPANKPPGRPRKVRCVDGDPACDAEPAPGICHIAVDVCFNALTPDLPDCQPRELEFYEVRNVQPDTDPRHDFEFQALEDQAGAFVLPVAANEMDACTGPVTMILKMPARVKKSGARFQKAKEMLETAALGPGGWRDDDRLSMHCIPDKAVDACAGVTSTFDQLQQHVFDRSCNRQTCHSAAQLEHTLSLAPGEAYAALVGAAPDDGTALAAGKARVFPGDLSRSYLLDKLRGDLGPTQGLRMPRDLPRLPRKTLRLVEEWIEAGAPETGFVSSIGCQGP